MTVTDQQVRKLMKALSKLGDLNAAAAAVGIDPKTARKYRDMGCLPSQIDRQPRSYRTRSDPFEAVWPEIELRLKDAPELEGKLLFEDLCERYPNQFHEGQIRSFQRRLKRWRASHGPGREIWFQQDHCPGEAMQTDFTWATKLNITIAGQAFDHMLCHSVLPYSNWQHATVCRSESMMALRRGIQESLRVLGHVPKWHQTDNSTAATHNLGDGKRSFNSDYLALMNHYGMKPRTIKIGKCEQNGDVESLNGVLKNRMEQHLELRKSRDFETVSDYENWLYELMRKSNRLRESRLNEELKQLRPLVVSPLDEFTELRQTVSRYSTISVLRNVYSVPSRLRGEELLVKVYEDRVMVYFAGVLEFETERLLGERRHRINYRHIIESLVKKPGAFARYRYREDLFPSLLFRQAYDKLQSSISEYRADVHYLQILKLAARNMECDVETALELLLEQNEIPSVDRVKELLESEQTAPELSLPPPDLTIYDGLYEDVDALQEVA